MVLQSREKRQLQQSLRERSTLRQQAVDDLSFIINLLSDTDPVTGHVQLDSITFSEVFKLYTRLNWNANVVLPARSYVHKIWTSLILEKSLSIRDSKTVSKCDRCIQLRTSIQNVSYHSDGHVDGSLK